MPPADPVREPARQRDLRERNLATVLARVAASSTDDGTAPSRAAIAAATGMARGTVSALVDALLLGGLVEELPPPPRTGAGRPANGLRLSGRRVAALGVELGASHVVACVRDLTGAVRARASVDSVDRTGPPERVLGASAELAVGVLADARAQGLDVVGGAWALPGLVDSAAGRLRLAPNLGWRDVDVLALLSAHPGLEGLPLAVDNEAALAAVAELWHPGDSPGGESFVLVTGEVGIGAGVVLDGRPLRGERGWSGELGHVTVDPAGPPCGCGARGCLEAYAGQEALLRRAGLAAERAGADALRRAALAGEALPLAALEQAGRALGVALAGAVNLLDVDAVVLGGACAPLAPWLAGPVRAELAERVLRARLLGVPVRVSATGSDAAVMGAAALVLQRVLDAPAALVA
ncbi:Sugar kinase of the NBD/HSP70 family, may contain an N-terminal HTH domain [Quadrisphaera granulorum]|uniref:Putative NBD/HSP70 family sugar kinase n=1 Tax=Quadrisphaera granulorum TaxID=317664 RepID=A0A316ACA7_9ACTN|nr:ROK family protein [Quadrisphaera granulorum]PWJ55222.1 putative NBD/HSP70 family sugar kinase [Quadrisphaera granulorum]SZE95731.1 Sugar kinase of the NBD/HSP70 family, may contain an N-terminal HTH domain [Quadrisphaera granulorum]